MSSAVLNPDNDYNWPPEPAPAHLTREVWNGFGTSVGVRLRALEAVGTGIESIQEHLQTLGLQILDDAINPLIVQTQESISDLAQQVSDTADANAQIIADFQSVVAVNLEELAGEILTVQGNLTALQEEIELILSGGIPAAQVAEDSTRVFVTPAQKALLASVLAAGFDGGTFE